jgi:RND family efflux transporter MFP subunit
MSVKVAMLALCCSLFVMAPGRAAGAALYEGIVIPVHEVELALPIDGIVAKVFVKEGDFVKEGEAILKLDDMLQKLEVERKKAIWEDQAEYLANRESMVILKSLLDSSRQLYETTASVSQTEVKNLEIQYLSLQGKVNTHEARKKQERLEYEIAAEVLTRYVLRSPINGMVTAIKREEGEWAKAGETVVTAVDTSVCHAEFNVDEKHSRGLKKGKTVTLRVSEGEGLSVKKGVVIFVSSVADKASALVKVKIEFENRTGRVIPGVLAKVSLD